MRKTRVYVDTSVFGGSEDEEFSEASNRFFDLVRSGRFVVLLSEETLRELENAPAAVHRLWDSLPTEQLEAVHIGQEVANLAQQYVEAGVLGVGSMSDALHVASASVAGADLILSWNFRHIVNFDRIRGFNGVNVLNGYRTMTILSPLEVGADED